MTCESPIFIFKGLDPAQYPDGLKVPCGRCLLCRIRRKSEWTDRMIHELNYHDGALFVTLTYDSNKVPIGDKGYMTLRKRDLQLFLKRLRKALEPRRIRYYAAGEYGDPSKEIITSSGTRLKTVGDRPHYHLIIYGMRPTLDDKYELHRAWMDPETGYAIGHIKVGLAERHSIQYVAGYVVDKLSGPLGDQEYAEKGREPLFCLMSKGIGRKYVQEDAKRLEEDISYTINGAKRQLPRYYVKKLDIEPERLRALADDTERKRIRAKTGHNETEIELYKNHGSQFKEYYDHDTKIQHQRSRNAQARIERSSKK